MTEIEKSRVLITGAASGLGRRMARGVAERGGHPILWDLDRDGLETLRREIGGETFVCDVSDREAVYRVAEEVGPVDILINNAGVVSGDRFLDIPDEKIERSLAVNTLALFWTTKAFLPSMIERGRGHLVTIASAAGLIGVSRLTDYSASKFAAVGLDESLRVELKKAATGVRTTLVCPYFTNTGMFEGVRTRFSFLLPILDEANVAEKTLRAIERNRARLNLPPMVYTIPLLRLLPASWFDAIAGFMGINVAMDKFVGRR